MAGKKKPIGGNLKALCEVLGIVVPLKNFTEEEQLKIHKELKYKLLISQDPIKAESYFAWVIKEVLVSPSKFFEFAEKKSEIFKHAVEQAGEGSEFQVRIEILNSMFMGILDVYPIFSLEGMLELINSELIPGQPQIGQTIAESNFITLNKFKIKEIELYLESKLIGQPEAIVSLVKHLKLMGSELESHCSLFFIGQTGVGKTHIAKLLASKLNNKLIKVNCNEMSHGHEQSKLIGAPPGFIGHTEKSYLKEKSDQSNQWVFLFDEIEKATPKLFDFLLALIDEGKIIDNSGHLLDFTKSIFLFTSNEGADSLGSNDLSFIKQRRSDESVKNHFDVAVKKKFKPEFINRIDGILYFNNLTKEDAKKIAEIELRKYPIRVTEDLINYVVDGGYSEEYGARNLNRFIRNNVTIILSEMILDQEIMGKCVYLPFFTDKKLNFRRLIHHEMEREKGTEAGETKRKAKENI